MATRKDKELWLLVTDPQAARAYVETYDWNLPAHLKPTRIVLDSLREIHFDRMSDEEAVIAATTILRDVEVPQVMRQKQYEEWEH